MNVYTGTHRYYCGIDLHARFMYICILDNEGNVVYHKNHRCSPEEFLNVIAPFRNGLAVGVECIFCWYWLADLCDKEGIDFILGHALYMKAIHGVKTKNDKIDSLKIARLLRGGNFPVAYVYPPQMRATRDLMRRRPDGSGSANVPNCLVISKIQRANIIWSHWEPCHVRIIVGTKR